MDGSEGSATHEQGHAKPRHEKEAEERKRNSREIKTSHKLNRYKMEMTHTRRKKDGLSNLSHAAVDAEFRPSDEAAFVAREEQDGGRDLFGPAEASQRNELG